VTQSPPIAAPTATYSVQVGQSDAAEWCSLLGRFDDASVYQSWSYGAVHWGRDEICHVVLKRHGQVVSIAQVRVKEMPALRKGIAYVRWGPLCRLRGQAFDVEALERLTAAMKEEFVVRRGLVLRVIPPAFENDTFAQPATSNWTNLGFSRKHDGHAYRTLRLDLRPSVELLRKQLDQKWRNCLNGAERNGLAVLEGTSLELYDKFVAIYEGMMARKQFETTIDVHEFRRLQRDLPEEHKMRIFLCEKDGKKLNAIIVSALGETGIYLLGATSEEGLRAKGAYLLQWRAVQWLKEQDCRWYDLGGINPETNPGVFHFKSGLGGQDVLQLGVFELSGDWISSLFVGAGEQAQAMVRRLRSWNRTERLRGHA